jgi:hypothetical protein
VLEGDAEVGAVDAVVGLDRLVVVAAVAVGLCGAVGPALHLVRGAVAAEEVALDRGLGAALVPAVLQRGARDEGCCARGEAGENQKDVR